MLPSELPPPSPRHQNSNPDMESLLLRRSYLQNQANSDGDQPRSPWLSLLPVEQSAVPSPAPPPVSATEPNPAASFMTPHRPAELHRERSGTVSDMTDATTSTVLRDSPPELVRSYPNSTLSTDSEELEDLDPASAALYGQGDNIDEESEEARIGDLYKNRRISLSTPDRRDSLGLAQLRQSIGVMSQEAKEQEADDMRAHHIYKLHLARLEEAHWGSS